MIARESKRIFIIILVIDALINRCRWFVIWTFGKEFIQKIFSQIWSVKSVKLFEFNFWGIGFSLG